MINCSFNRLRIVLFNGFIKKLNNGSSRLNRFQTHCLFSLIADFFPALVGCRRLSKAERISG
jgi:hypothetical protein